MSAAPPSPLTSPLPPADEADSVHVHSELRGSLGAMSRRALWALVSAGDVADADLFWYPGLDTWYPVGDHPALFADLRPAATLDGDTERLLSPALQAATVPTATPPAGEGHDAHNVTIDPVGDAVGDSVAALPAEAAAPAWAQSPRDTPVGAPSPEDPDLGFIEATSAESDPAIGGSTVGAATVGAATVGAATVGAATVGAATVGVATDEPPPAAEEVAAPAATGLAALLEATAAAYAPWARRAAADAALAEGLAAAAAALGYAPAAGGSGLLRLRGADGARLQLDLTDLPPISGAPALRALTVERADAHGPARSLRLLVDERGAVIGAPDLSAAFAAVHAALRP